MMDFSQGVVFRFHVGFRGSSGTWVKMKLIGIDCRKTKHDQKLSPGPIVTTNDCGK